MHAIIKGEVIFNNKIIHLHWTRAFIICKTTLLYLTSDPSIDNGQQIPHYYFQLLGFIHVKTWMLSSSYQYHYISKKWWETPLLLKYRIVYSYPNSSTIHTNPTFKHQYFLDWGSHLLIIKVWESLEKMPCKKINRLSNECKQGVKNERFVMKRFLNV
jgi:hypothetical protein